MEKCVILVDNSNIFIGGRQLAAAEIESDSGEDGARLVDPSWRMDFGSLMEVLAAGRHVEKAVLVGSRPPFNEAVWTAAEKEGFEVILHDRNAEGKEKAIDTELVARGTEIVCISPEPMVLVIASGDADLLPLITIAKEYGWKVELCAFTNSFHPQSPLCEACDEVRPLDEYFEELGRRRDDEPKAA
jgi:uncharacterized LabA/DUF88 family protein